MNYDSAIKLRNAMKRITTPAAITPAITEFAKDLARDGVSQYVYVANNPLAKIDRCHYNVDQMVTMRGGQMVYGWAIWEWPRAFLSGEFHAVWRNPDGLLQCVSRHRDGERRILFVPDSDRKYEGAIRPNVFKALTDDPDVLQHIKDNRNNHMAKAVKSLAKVAAKF